MGRRSCQFFTMMEILIVMALIVMVSGMGAISLKKALASQRFESSLSRLKENIQLCRQVAFLSEQQVALRLKQNEEGLQCIVTMEKTLKGPLLKELCRPLPALFHLHYQSRPQSEVTLVFNPGIGASTFGSIEVSSQKELKDLNLLSVDGGFSLLNRHSKLLLVSFPQEIVDARAKALSPS